MASLARPLSARAPSRALPRGRRAAGRAAVAVAVAPSLAARSSSPFITRLHPAPSRGVQGVCRAAEEGSSVEAAPAALATPEESFAKVKDCLVKLEEFDYPATEVKLYLMMQTRPSKSNPKFDMRRQVDTFWDLFVLGKPMEGYEDLEALPIIVESVESLLESQIRERENFQMTSDALDGFDIDDRTKAKVAGVIEKVAVGSIQFSLWNAMILAVVALGVFNILFLSGGSR